MGQKAKQASKLLALASTEQKNKTLEALVRFIQQDEETILKANSQDIEEGKKKGLSDAMIDRLSLQGRLKGIAKDIETVHALSDPVGERMEAKILPNGLQLFKQRVPLGVLGVIYESRPNVTLDVASLAIKTGNAAILRGGSETLRTNQALLKTIEKALEEGGLPKESIQLVNSPDRALVLELLKLHDFVDMIIPRGGAGLHAFCREEATIPVITGGVGVCHLFVDASADQAKSLEVIFNAKTQRPTVCNALDTLLVHEAIASEFLPKVQKRLSGVTLKLGPQAEKIIRGDKATAEDWYTEWLGLTLGIQVVANLDEAIAHIAKHSTGHSDGILTETKENANQFIRTVDSAAVYVNASTRFTDGAQFGLGAEVAISTQKLHARGPMGLPELTSYKWVIEGNYTTRS